jgi:hypothetical protein
MMGWGKGAINVRRLWIAVLASALLAGGAQASTIVFTADLTGAAENPANDSPGTGFAEVIYDGALHALTVSTSFQHLVGPTTVAHIHCCVAPPGNVGVATFPGTFPGFPVGVMAGTYTGTWDLTLTTSYTPGFLAASGGTASGAEAALVAGMLAGQAYVNIHTTRFPGGEIRGFVAPIPEPGAVSLFVVGALMIGGQMRRLGRST